MFKALILQAQHNLPDARMEFMIPLAGRQLPCNRREARPALVDAVPRVRSWRADTGREHHPALSRQADRERRAEARHEGVRLAAPEERLHPPPGDCRQSPAGQRMAGQIVDASLVPAPKRRNTEDEKQAIKEGRTAREIWPDEPDKAAQKDTNAPSRGLQANHCRAVAGR